MKKSVLVFLLYIEYFLKVCHYLDEIKMGWFVVIRKHYRVQYA